jgi:hypothetical protein
MTKIQPRGKTGCRRQPAFFLLFLLSKPLTMTAKPIFLLFVAALLLAACTKGDDQPAEKPILSLLQQSNILIDTMEAATDWIYGFQFKVNNDGAIGQIGMKVPVTGSFTAKLWDVSANEVLKEVSLTANTLHEEVFESFDNIAVTADQTLGITITANGFYKISKTDNSPFTFPIQKNTISILSFHEAKVSEIPGGAFPLTTNNEELSPCVDVVFIDQ